MIVGLIGNERCPREIMAGLAVEEATERLEHFLESKKVASLHLSNHQTGTLRQVEARSPTDYLARALLESREQQQHRDTVKSAARDHHARLAKDSEKASDYHEAARELLPRQKAANHTLPIRRRSTWRSTLNGKTTRRRDRETWD